MDTTPTSETIQGYADILAFQQSHPAERAAVEAELAARIKADRDDSTVDLCLGVARAAGIDTTPYFASFCRATRTPWAPVLVGMAIDAALALYLPSDADSLQELVDGALEAQAWRLDPRSPSRGIAA